MATVTLADIPLDAPENVALLGVAHAITRADTTYSTRSAGGAWGMARSIYGQPPTDGRAQAMIACRLWQDLRAGVLRDLPMDGSERMIALAVVGWYAPAQYSTAANKQNPADILSAAGLPWLKAGVMRAAPIVASLWSRSAAGSAEPAGGSSASAGPAEKRAGKSAGKTAGYGWLLLIALAGFGAWAWWKYGRGAP